MATLYEVDNYFSQCTFIRASLRSPHQPKAYNLHDPKSVPGWRNKCWFLSRSAFLSLISS